MDIRTRLTLQFISIVTVTLTLAALAIYWFSADFRKEELYARLKSKAMGTAKLLVEIEGVDAELLRVIQENTSGSLPNEDIVIYNEQNLEIFTTIEGEPFPVSDELLDLIRSKEVMRLTVDEYEAIGLVFFHKNGPVVAIAAATDIYGFSKLDNLRNILIAVLLVCISGVSIAGWFFSGKALAPIAIVVEQVDNITIANLNARVNEGNGRDEIALLAKTFNKMLEGLEASFKLQKDFIANASHELRTPLTVISGQLEVILMRPRDNGRYVQTLQSVFEDIKNLGQISNRLLLLAQANSDVANTNLTILRVDEVVWQVATELKKLNPDYQIGIAISEGISEEHQLQVKGNEQLLKVAIGNLAENGCKYSEDRRVQIEISSSSENIALAFADRGIGIPAEEVKKIFEPFYRAQNSHGIRGHGLGLSLVKKVTAIHNGSIHVDSKVNLGTTFTLLLPVTKQSAPTEQAPAHKPEHYR